MGNEDMKKIAEDLDNAMEEEINDVAIKCLSKAKRYMGLNGPLSNWFFGIIEFLKF